MPPQIQPGRHHREHPREAYVRAQSRDVYAAVLRPSGRRRTASEGRWCVCTAWVRRHVSPDPQQAHPTTSPIKIPPSSPRRVQPRLPEGEYARRHCRRRDALGDYAGGVVDEALAFEDGDDAAWHAEALGDGRGGYGVGGGDDSAQVKAAAQVMPDRGVGDDGDDAGRIDTNPTASSEIGRRFARKSRQEVKSAET